MYRLRHYLGDVIAGISLGAALTEGLYWAIGSPGQLCPSGSLDFFFGR